MECHPHVEPVRPHPGPRVAGETALPGSQLDASLRNRIAAELLATDPVEAESIVDAIPSPRTSRTGLTSGWPRPCRSRSEIGGAGCWSAPRSRSRRRRATGAGPTRTGGCSSWPGSPAAGWISERSRRHAHGSAKGWRRSRRSLRLSVTFPDFLATAARLETDRVLSLISDLGNARRRRCYVVIAEALADEHPAEAERVFQLIDDSSDVPFSEHKNEIALGFAGPWRRTDPERARRLIAALKTPREQACALGPGGARPGRPGQDGRALGPGRVDPVDRWSERPSRQRRSSSTARSASPESRRVRSCRSSRRWRRNAWKRFSGRRSP